ncbi:ComEC/Rec2 family competence protein [Sphingorhabdus arenilitoris]|uniref:ComEC/Rec2 family competence protein n=1 Tax=Sphingorhabdus arenilitoris TaxID=1490041 RepID=A0ABV8RFR0_9SPHN
MGLSIRNWHLHWPGGAIEGWIDSERDQWPLWVPVAVGAGIVTWELQGNGALWAVTGLCAALILIAYITGRQSSLMAIIKIAAFCFLAGFLAIYFRSAAVGTPPLKKMWIGEFYGQITKVEHITARDIVRFELATGGHAGLPEKVRVNLDAEKYRPEFTSGAVIRMKARLVPPAGPSVPGGYDFARRAWFDGLGATGTILGNVTLYRPSSHKPTLGNVRRALSAHITSQLPPGSGSIAAALATGDRGAISDDDAEAMRNSGMAHLLSISGLHVTAVVGAIFLLMSRILALFPRIALRFPVPLIAAAVAAMGAIGYTLLTGSEVPTIRSCVAALLILAALAMGRDAISLRLVAFGASVIMLIWPESLAGPSFQLSFAAVSTIIVLHESRWMQNFTRAGQQDGLIRKMGRSIVILLITGAAIELILAPIAIFHFHKSGLYGALANVIAIPMTTFLVMPFEALALTFDLVGLGAPFWWVTDISLRAILALAHGVSAAPGAVSMLPVMPQWAFAAMILGALYFGIFRRRARYFGIPLFLIGLTAMITAPYPDILVTGDGKHLAVVGSDGKLALLRDRAGDYVRDTLRENAGVKAEPVAITDWPGAQCTADACVITIDRDGRRWNILALRSRYYIPSMELAVACKRVDIVVSDRWLPRSCKPKWLRADRESLAKTGGLTFYLSNAFSGPRVESVVAAGHHHPWIIAGK